MQPLGFALILQLPWDVTAVAVALGLLAGLLRFRGARVHRLEIVRPVLASFVCGCVVFVLADRLMVSGATRLAYALVQIVFLIFACWRRSSSPACRRRWPSPTCGATWAGGRRGWARCCSPWAWPCTSPRSGRCPGFWRCASRRGVGLVLADALGSSYLAAMIGAIFMAVVAEWSAAHSAGPPRLVTFAPSFILLIPAALALTGLTQIFGAEHAVAFADLSTAMFVIVAIAMRPMIGVNLYERVARLLGRRVPET